MKALDIAKLIVQAVLSLAVGEVVGNAIKATTPSHLTMGRRVIIGIGTMAITGVVGDEVVKSIETRIEEFQKKQNS